MRATAHYYRVTRHGGPIVRLEMSLAEFREHVEWLEMIDPDDGCTIDWRAELDRIDPPDSDDES
jgi:hypothetical protein